MYFQTAGGYFLIHPISAIKFYTVLGNLHCVTKISDLRGGQICVQIFALGVKSRKRKINCYFLNFTIYLF